MNHVPSTYQKAVYQHITDETSNAVISAVAGSGKSTTIVNALELIPTDKKVLFLAFNKAIVEELKIKIGDLSNVEIKTLHSLGMSAILKTYKTRVDNNKYSNYLRNQAKYGALKPVVRLDYEDFLLYQNNIKKLVDLARVNLCTNISELSDIANKHEILTIDNESEQVLNILDWGKNNLVSIDFTDMIYLPNVKKINTPVYDYVFIDECQDLNKAQRELFLSCVKPETGRFIAVGDEKQAIYGFAGADVESFHMLKNLPNTVTLPLSVCYRCDESIINLAKEIVPQIEAKESVNQGVVDYNAKIENINDADMVLCRVTAPLVQLCMQYIANGVKAYVKGRDIGVNLINMINKTKRQYLSDTLEQLNIDLDKTAQKIMNKDKCTLNEAKESTIYTNQQDKINAILAIAKNLKTTSAVINRITSIFKDDQKAGICLSTIHKSKGLESNRVFILKQEKLLLPNCMKIAWMAEQEYNLVYVAYTRAKNYLGFITDFNPDKE